MVRFRAAILGRTFALVASALLIAQGLALFGHAPGRGAQARAAAAELIQLVGADPSLAVICLTDNGADDSGAPVHHRAHGDCALCAAFGHAAAPPPALWTPARSAVATRIVYLAPSRAAPAAPRNSSARSRAPPATA